MPTTNKRAVAQRTNKAATAPVQATVLVPPMLGEIWPDQGGRYAGVVFNDDGTEDRYLILHAEQHDGADHKELTKWAKGLRGDGHKDFRIPAKREAPVLYANLPHLFRKAWYWTSTQHADGSDYAWMQDFGDGDQLSYRKSNRCRGCAVRTIKINH